MRTKMTMPAETRPRRTKKPEAARRKAPVKRVIHLVEPLLELSFEQKLTIRATGSFSLARA